MNGTETLALFLDLSAKAFLLACGAGMALWLLRVRDAGRAHAVWRAVLLGLLALAPLCVVTPGAVSLALPDPGTLGTRASRPPGFPSTGAVPIVQHQPEVVEAGGTPALPGRGWLTVLAGVYALVATTLLARLCLGLLLYRRLLRTAVPIEDPDLQDTCRRLCAAAGGSVRPDLLESPAVRVPLAVGYRRPRILLPEDWRGWETAKIESVLAHELAHLCRGDHWTHLLGAVLRCVYWFHPVAWLVSRRLSQLAERAADDLAVLWTGHRRAYARHLLEMAAALQGRPERVALGLAMARRSHLGQRIEALLDPAPAPARRLTHGQRGLLLGLAALTVLACTAVRLAPVEPEAAQAGALDLGSLDPEVRARAAIDLGHIRSFRALRPLTHALRDPSARVRRMAAWALGQIADPGTLGPVREAQRDPEAAVRRMAGWAELQIRLDRGARRWQRLEGAAPGSVREPGLFAELAGDLRHADYRVRQNAALALSRAADPWSVPALASLLQDDVMWVRWNAAWSLGETRSPRAAPALQAALADASPRVRAAAQTALTSLASDRPPPPAGS